MNTVVGQEWMDKKAFIELTKKNTLEFFLSVNMSVSSYPSHPEIIFAVGWA